MELFRNVNVNWMGKAKYFVTVSLVLLAIGWASVARNHWSLNYGIDFRGGTSWEVPAHGVSVTAARNRFGLIRPRRLSHQVGPWKGVRV